MGYTAGYYNGITPQGTLSINASDQYSSEFEMQIFPLYRNLM